MRIIFAIIGLLAGVAIGIAFGNAITYSGISKKNTFVDHRNPELSDIPPNSIGTRIFLGIFGLGLLVAGGFVLNYSISNWGMSAAELNAQAGPNTHVGANAGAFAVFGGFMIFMGSLLVYAAISGK